MTTPTRVAAQTPCKTFAGAISKTAPSGEIDVLDPGGFGALTITKAITIDGGGVVAGVLVSGTNGFVVAAGPSDVVIIRNLQFNGLPGTGVGSGLTGILFNSGAALHVERCNIFGFSVAGIGFQPSTGNSSLYVSNTSIQDNSPSGTANGIIIKPSGTANVVAALTNLTVIDNKNGVRVDGTGGTGSSEVTLSDSAISNNNSLGVVSVSGSGQGTVALDMANDTVANNGSTGVYSTGANAGLTMGASVVTNDNMGLRQVAPAILNSYGNNIVAGNVGGNVVGTVTSVSPH